MTRRRATVDVWGLDVSLRGTAAALVLCSWDAKSIEEVSVFSCAHALPKEHTLEDRCVRLGEISRAVVGLISSDVVVFVEDYSFGSALAHARGVAELTGCIKLALYREKGIVARPIAIPTIRKALLGKVPHERSGEAVQRAFFAAFPQPGEKWTADQVDAFAVANAGRARLGMPSMTLEGWNAQGDAARQEASAGCGERKRLPRRP